MKTQPPETEAPRDDAADIESASDIVELLQIRMRTRAEASARRGRRARVAQAEPLTKNLMGGVVGNILEWYDFAVFGFFSPVIGRLFFPSQDPLNSLLCAFGVFGVAYFMRPVGGVLFGHLGDRFGRKKALQISVMTMAVPTFLIGLLPTFEQIGWLAPLLLILLRMLQGLSVGGELIGSMAFVAEIAPPGKRGYYTSWTFASSFIGIMLGSLSAVALNDLLGPEALTAWGWRLPFLAGIVIGMAALWMRRELNETPVFEQMQREGNIGENPLREVVNLMPLRILQSSALVMLSGGGFYVLFVWWPTLLSQLLEPRVPHSLALNTISMLVVIGLVPLMGRFSDTVGRKPLLVAGATGVILAAWPLFMLIDHGSVLSALFAQVCFAILISVFIGPIPATLVELFPARVRYSAIGLGYNISLSIFGGSAPLVATWLVARNNDIGAGALYLIFLAVPSLIAALCLPDRETDHRVEE